MNKIKLLILDRIDYLRLAIANSLLPDMYFIGFCPSKRNETLWRAITRHNIRLSVYKDVLRIMEEGYGTDWRDEMYNHVQNAMMLDADTILRLSKEFKSK